jgi:myosin heavy subunit
LIWIYLQAAWRSYIAQKQAAMRRFLHHVSIKHAALVADRLAARQVKAAVVIQACWRARAARVQFREAVSAAVRLQSFWRMARARQAFLQLRSAAVLLQRLTRSMLARGTAAKAHKAAMTVQAAWRGWTQRRR